MCVCIYTHTHIYIYIYVYICLYVCDRIGFLSQIFSNQSHYYIDKYLFLNKYVNPLAYILLRWVVFTCNISNI